MGNGDLQINDTEVKCILFRDGGRQWGRRHCIQGRGGGKVIYISDARFIYILYIRFFFFFFDDFFSGTNLLCLGCFSFSLSLLLLDIFKTSFY